MTPEQLAATDDRDLLAAHCAGDRDAFGEIVRRHRDRLWAVALRMTGDREMAADAVQDGLISAFRRAETFRGDAKVTTWLHRIVVNACLDRLRAAKPTTTLDDAPQHALRARGDTAEAVTAQVAVQRGLAQLAEGQRAAVVLVDLHGLSVAEAADVLGVAEGTVKSRCARGRAALAAILGDLRPG